jgi:hypothetical protein
MHLVRIASIWAAIALSCLPALAGDPDDSEQHTGADVPREHKLPQLPMSGRASPSPGPMNSLPGRPAPMLGPPASLLGPPGVVAPGPAAFPSGVVQCVPVYVPCCVPCAPAPASMCYPGYPVGSAAVPYYPPPIPPYDGMTSAPSGVSDAFQLLISEGIIWLQQKEYDNAIKTFNEAARLDRRAIVYYCRGEAWYRKSFAQIDRANEYLERAANDYTVATVLEQDYVDAYNACGDVYRRLNRLELANEKYDEGIRQSGRQSALAEQSDAAAPTAPDTSIAQAYRGRAAVHIERAKLYAQRNDQEAVRQELKNAADDYNRASQVRLAGAEDSPIATLSPEAKPQSAH